MVQCKWDCPGGGPGAVLAAGTMTQAKPGRRGNGDCKTEVQRRPSDSGDQQVQGDRGNGREEAVCSPEGSGCLVKRLGHTLREAWGAGTGF